MGRAENCRNISQELTTEAGRLQLSLDEARQTQAEHYKEFKETSAATNRDWSAAVQLLDAKLEEQVRNLSTNIGSVADDLAALTQASKTMQAGVQEGVSMVLESVRGFNP